MIGLLEVKLAFLHSFLVKTKIWLVINIQIKFDAILLCRLYVEVLFVSSNAFKFNPCCPVRFFYADSDGCLKKSSL